MQHECVLRVLESRLNQELLYVNDMYSLPILTFQQ